MLLAEPIPMMRKNRKKKIYNQMQVLFITRQICIKCLAWYSSRLFGCLVCYVEKSYVCSLKASWSYLRFVAFVVLTISSSYTTTTWKEAQLIFICRVGYINFFKRRVVPLRWFILHHAKSQIKQWSVIKDVSYVISILWRVIHLTNIS